MSTILLGKTRSEFLATPSLVRFLSDREGRPSLAIKASALQLKYFVAAERISLSILPLEGGDLAYAITIPDDPDDPAYLWSMVENDNELTALKAFLEGAACSLHLFNEIAINVASTTIQLDDPAEVGHGLLGDGLSQSAPKALRIARSRVVEAFDALHRGGLEEPDGRRLTLALNQPWHHPRSWYYSNGHAASYLSIVDNNDGAQQEALCLWLTDAIASQGAYLNPMVTPGEGKPRELCDVLLTSEGYTFVIESKALAVLTRSKLPTRRDLHDDVVSHVGKAAKQTSGALRFLRMGYPVSDQRGADVSINLLKPLHLIILIPDLSLLSASDNLGNVFLADHIQKTECYVHLLDPAQLLRVVQAATTISRRSRRVSRIAALDWYLTKRLEKGLELDSPDFDFLLRFDDDNGGGEDGEESSTS